MPPRFGEVRRGSKKKKAETAHRKHTASADTWNGFAIGPMGGGSSDRLKKLATGQGGEIFEKSDLEALGAYCT